jgi:hypothetical protein
MKNDEPRAARISGHPTTETLVDYQADLLTEAEDRTIEEHLATCDSCAEMSRRVFRLSDEWERVMTPAAPWAAPAESAWLTPLAGTLQGAALIAFESTRLTIRSCARLVAEMTAPTSGNIDALLNRDARWSFDLLSSPARGVNQHTSSSTDVEVRSRTSLPTVVETKLTDKGQLRVAIDRARSQIVVTIDRYPPEPESLPTLKLLRKNGQTVDGSWTVSPARGGFRDLRAVFVVREADEYVVAAG